MNQAGKMLKMLREKKESYWVKRGEKMALDLFHAMASRVPAYGDFLKKNKINPQKISSIKDFSKVPMIDKDNYLRAYKLEKLCWDGNFTKKHWDISSTSGSTGAPFYFPRDKEQNSQYALAAELYLVSNFEIHRKTTLYINCFALGVWIGGLFTYEAIKILSERGRYNLTLINPGLNKVEIIKAVKNLGFYFDQVIIAGYPPFIKDTVDDAIIGGINWRNYNVKFIFSAEGFSESFRDYIASHVGLKNILLDSLNHYGTVDQGTLAYETPLAILVRRETVQNEKLFKSVFREGIAKLPTLAQYNPGVFFFEEIGGGLICSSRSGIPLVRYDLKDSGGLVGFDEMKKKFSDHDVNLKRRCADSGIVNKIWNLPFVYVYERKDLSISFCGANIYPETIKRVLFEDNFNSYFTGKFVLEVKYDKNQNPFLCVNIENKNGVSKVSDILKKKLTKSITARLLRENSEYHSVYYDQRKEKAIPRLRFWSYGTSPYFVLSGKQKWVVKNSGGSETLSKI